jgi:hypothetical protein
LRKKIIDKLLWRNSTPDNNCNVNLLTSDLENGVFILSNNTTKSYYCVSKEAMHTKTKSPAKSCSQYSNTRKTLFGFIPTTTSFNLTTIYQYKKTKKLSKHNHIKRDYYFYDLKQLII